MDSGGKLKQELRQSQSDLNQTATEPLCPQGQEIQPSLRQPLSGQAFDILAASTKNLRFVLAQRIARAHGFARTGARIGDRVYLQVRNVVGVDESTGRFLSWENESLTLPLRRDSSKALRRTMLNGMLGFCCLTVHAMSQAFRSHREQQNTSSLLSSMRSHCVDDELVTTSRSIRSTSSCRSVTMADSDSSH